MNKIYSAKRIGEVKEYYFSLKLKEIAEMNRNGDNVINLGIGSPDLPPSQKTIDALVQSAKLESNHGYQSYVGIPELREEFSNWYKRKYSVEINPANEILPLMGSKEGIMHISMAFLNPGDGVLIPNPGYPTYASVSTLLDANIIYYPLKDANNWYPDFEELENMDLRGEISLENVKLMWCNYPNMPTGTNGSIELFEKFVKFGKKHNIVICHDNPYSFILNDKPISIMSVEGAKDICIELNSLSKTFNMSGWRVGMVTSNSQFIEWILRVKSNMDSGMFKPLQIASIEALKSEDGWYQDMTNTYLKRRNLASQILECIGAEIKDNQVGMFLWGKVDGNGEDICDKILYESKVFLTPGSIFGSEGNSYVRISLCSNEQTLEKALNRIKK